MELTNRQRKFINAYLKHGNGTQAAKDAGYSEKTAQVQASRLLTYAMVRQEIEKRQKNLAKKTDLSIEWCLEQYKKLAESMITDFMEIGPNGVSLKDFSLVDPDKVFAVEEVSETITQGGGGSQRVKLARKKDALDSIMRHLGGFNDKVEVTAKPTLSIKRFESDEVVELGMGED